MKTFKILLIVASFVTIYFRGMSQECDTELDPFYECPDTDEASPLDKGVWFLIAAGSLYGAKTIQKQTKDTEH